MSMLPSLNPAQSTHYAYTQLHNRVVCVIPRGQGKTLVCLRSALDYLNHNSYKKIYYVCHKNTQINKVMESLEYNIAVDPTFFDVSAKMAPKCYSIATKNHSEIYVGNMDMLVYAGVNTLDFLIYDELDVVTETSQIETFKIFQRFNKQRQLIVTSLAYKSFMDNLRNKVFGDYKYCGI